MLRVFVSQPMRDKTDEEIKKERREAIEHVKKEVGEDVEVIDSLWFLGNSFELLSSADVVVFIGNWRDYRGCKMEHEAAKQYGIKVMYYDERPVESDTFCTV